MACFTRILAVLDTGLDDNPVFDQALQLARNCQAELTLLDIVPELSWTARWAMPNHQELQQAVIEKKEQGLARLKSRVDDVPVQTEVAEGRSSTLIIQRVLRDKYDLTIQMAKGRFSKRSGTMGSTSMRLVRKCPGTVWLVKPAATYPPRKIMASVDATPHDEEHARLNTRILDWAALLRDKLACEMHAIHAWNVYGENVLREHMNAEEFEQMVQKAEREHEKSFASVLQPYQLADENGLNTELAHLAQGDPALTIPQAAADWKIDALVMGTVAREGMQGLLLGNTAERILYYVSCSVIAVKPEGFVSPIQLQPDS